jgi:GTP diphosphokinase / guanosine-3',5'-bis(diphosphate) 3'-diphosphatase
MIHMATAFAFKKHEGQTRKNATKNPYIQHVLAVKNIVNLVCNDEIALAGAILHDTLEDTDTTYAELVENFGSQVADLVLELSDDKSLEKETRKLLQIKNAPNKSEFACYISFADKIHNCQSIIYDPPVDWSNERKLAYFVWAELCINGFRFKDETFVYMFQSLKHLADNMFDK